MSEDLTLEQKLDRLKKTTQSLRKLPKDFALPNGWKAREVYIHLWSWDNELNKLVEARLSGTSDKFQFDHDKIGIDYNKWNQVKLDEKKNLSLEEAKKLFFGIREKFIANLEKLLKHPSEDEQWEAKDFRRTSNIIDIWWHDDHHLKNGGIETNFNL